MPVHTLLGRHWSEGVTVTLNTLGKWDALGSPACHPAVGAGFHCVILLGQWYQCHSAGKVGFTIQLGSETESGKSGTQD